jgi:DNA-binding NtrC family response regulator
MDRIIDKGVNMYKVLLVDDDEEFLFIIGEYLGAHGIESHLAHSAAQARKRLNHCEYDLVISDVQMPGESGLDLYRSVSFRYPGLPFILMSGNLDPRLRREALSMGVCNFVEKPFELSYLKHLITDPDRCEKRVGIGAPAA